MDVQHWLESVPAISVYLVVGVVICTESLGIPFPGEIVLVSATLLAASQADINPYVLGASAVLGAVVGDSTGYLIGRKGGKPLLAWLGRKFPRHFGEEHVATAEQAFTRWGMWAVFIGRFIALLRIFAGPLAGVLRMPYWKFLIANALGGILWAGGTTAVVYSVGKVAEAWLTRFSWLGLLVAVLFGLGAMLVVRRRTKRGAAQAAAVTTPTGSGGPTAGATDTADTARPAGDAGGAGGAAHEPRRVPAGE